MLWSIWPGGFDFGLGQPGEIMRRQDRDDGDHDEQLDQCKTPARWKFLRGRKSFA